MVLSSVVAIYNVYMTKVIVHFLNYAKASKKYVVYLVASWETLMNKNVL